MISMCFDNSIGCRSKGRTGMGEASPSETYDSILNDESLIKN